MTADIDAILAVTEDETHRLVTTCDVILRQDLVSKHAELDAELARVTDEDQQHNRPPRAPAIADELAALEAEIAEATVRFRFRALSRREWVDLLAKHPPTRAQLDEHKKTSGSDWRTRTVLDHNPDTYPVALIAACCVDPPMDLERAKRLEQSLHFSQFERLYATALSCNTGGNEAPKSVAAGLIRQWNERSETTAALEGSVAASS